LQSLAVLSTVLAVWFHADTRVAIDSARGYVREAGGSVSCGATNRGALSNAAKLPAYGDGFVVTEPWRSRGRRYGTDELIGLIRRSAEKVAEDYPGGVIGIGDLSKKQGGPASTHRSHQSGRDADLIYYALHSDGSPFVPDGAMAYFQRSGVANDVRSGGHREVNERYIDLRRNWAFVKALLTDDETRATHIFTSNRIRGWLLAYADAADEPEWLIKRAQRVVMKAKNSGGHNDHMHIRISCSSDDIDSGACRENSHRRSRSYKWYTKVECPSSY
jgi:penicillin-insensitive murein endopeptidase